MLNLSNRRHLPFDKKAVESYLHEELNKYTDSKYDLLCTTYSFSNIVDLFSVSVIVASHSEQSPAQMQNSAPIMASISAKKSMPGLTRNPQIEQGRKLFAGAIISSLRLLKKCRQLIKKSYNYSKLCFHDYKFPISIINQYYIFGAKFRF